MHLVGGLSRPMTKDVVPAEQRQICFDCVIEGPMPSLRRGLVSARSRLSLE